MEALYSTPDAPDASQDRQTVVATRSGSCTTCAKAKSRCIRHPGKDICERCARLHRACHIREPVARKRKSVKVTNTVQLRHLETKLEKIAQTLSAKHHQDASISPDKNTSSSHTVIATPHHAFEDIYRPMPEQDAADKIATANLNASVGRSSHSEAMSENGMVFPITQESDVLFDRYLRLMAPTMPFVVLPPDTSASTLAGTEPFLMHAIQLVASFHNTCEQQRMATKFMRQICERLVINGEKSLGLLQGLLVFVNWYNPHLYSPKNSTILLHLAIALTTDLNIDRGPTNCEKAQMESALRAYGFAQPAKIMTNDERRAVLGTFYLTSTIFTSFRKVDILHWTPWLTDCVNILSEAREYESDDYLVQLVHMQRIMQEAMFVEYNNTPCHLYANSFLKDLGSLRLPLGQSTMATVLRLQDACTKIAIWQRSFIGLSNDAVGTGGLRQRLDGMWRRMEAVKVYIDLYIEMPVEEYPIMPFGVFAQFAYTFVVIVRALCLEMDGWDAHTLHGLIDFSDIIDKVSSRFSAVSQASLDGITLRNEAFSKLGGKLRWAKTFHDARLASISSETGPVLPTDQGSKSPQFTVGSGPIQQFPTHPDVAIDQFLHPFMGFEDFWDGFNDPLQTPVGFDHSFGTI